MKQTDFDGYTICCPKCGKIQQKSFSTDSIFLCQRCNISFYTYLGNGLLLETSPSKLQDQRFREQLQKFALAWGELSKKDMI